MNDSWIHTLAKHWGREPVHVPNAFGGSPLPTGDVFSTVIDVCAPFRAGTRMRALPDVAVWTPMGRTRALHDLLPDSGDDPRMYAKKMRAELDAAGFLVRIAEGFMGNYRLWSQMRDLVRSLWKRVGYPVVPVKTFIRLGSNFEVHLPADEVAQAGITLVLSGGADITISGGGKTVDMTVGPGDVVYHPAGFARTESFHDDYMAVQVQVIEDSRQLSASVFNRGALAVDNALDVDKVPYLQLDSYHGRIPAAGPFKTTAETMRDNLDPESEARISAILWTQQTSAACLDPAPDPRQPIEFEPDTRVRLSSLVVRNPQADGSEMWAANGHAFSVQGEAAAEWLQEFKQCTDVTVEELCGGSQGLEALLQRLYVIRAVEMVAQDGGSDV